MGGAADKAPPVLLAAGDKGRRGGGSQGGETEARRPGDQDPLSLVCPAGAAKSGRGAGARPRSRSRRLWPRFLFLDAALASPPVFLFPHLSPTSPEIALGGGGRGCHWMEQRWGAGAPAPARPPCASVSPPGGCQLKLCFLTKFGGFEPEKLQQGGAEQGKGWKGGRKRGKRGKKENGGKKKEKQRKGGRKDQNRFQAFESSCCRRGPLGQGDVTPRVTPGLWDRIPSLPPLPPLPQGQVQEAPPPLFVSLLETLPHGGRNRNGTK